MRNSYFSPSWLKFDLLPNIKWLEVLKSPLLSIWYLLRVEVSFFKALAKVILCSQRRDIIMGLSYVKSRISSPLCSTRYYYCYKTSEKWAKFTNHISQIESHTVFCATTAAAVLSFPVVSFQNKHNFPIVFSFSICFSTIQNSSSMNQDQCLSWMPR